MEQGRRRVCAAERRVIADIATNTAPARWKSRPLARCRRGGGDDRRGDGHYNRIARDLAERPEDYAPVLGIDLNSGDTLWEPWIDGFERAMRLRPDVWEEIAPSDDEEASASISMIVGLFDFYCGRSELTEEAEDELDRLAPGMISEFVCNLNAWTKFRRGGQAHGSGDDGCCDPCGCGRGSARRSPLAGGGATVGSRGGRLRRSN